MLAVYVRDFINENYWYKRTDKLDKFIIDLSSFDTSKVTRCSGMFQNLHKDTIIIISNKFTKCKEQFLLKIKSLILMKSNVKSNLKIAKNEKV